MKYWGVAALVVLAASCQNGATVKEEQAQRYDFPITNLSDTAYPDDPDIGYRAEGYAWKYFSTGSIFEQDSAFGITFQGLNGDSTTITHLQLDQYIPTLPDSLKSDRYLSLLSLVNQEWNRNQVQFSADEFSSNNKAITRVDLARNCLNAYLWEVILYADQGGKELPLAHGWFNFPKPLYAELFQRYNRVPFSTYSKSLENWMDPPSKPVELSKLRTVLDTIPVTFADSSDAMYPLAGARKKKFKEIIRPFPFATMRDLQSDSTQFATFAPPGIYKRSDPRHTELGRLRHLRNIIALDVKSRINGDTLQELQLTFTDSTGTRETRLIIGGINFAAFPSLPTAEANNGWKAPMGFSSHTFYETYSEHEKCRTSQNPYYAYFCDADGNWLDSHKIGVDGPLVHFSYPDRKDLNLWLLSFERHALVGHYDIHLDRPPVVPAS